MFSERTTDKWMTLLQTDDSPCTPVQDVETLVDDPPETCGMIAEMEYTELETFKLSANPANFASVETGANGPLLCFGEHTAKVLAELGYDNAKRKRQQLNNVIYMWTVERCDRIRAAVFRLLITRS